MRLTLLALATILVSACPSFAGRQEVDTPTVHVNAHAVLVDVVVTDDRGNPVTDLQKSAFHVLDNRRLQTINAFEKHTGGIIRRDPERLAPKDGGRSNDVADALAVRNVFLIDTSRMDIVVQMSLYKQLVHFVRNLPPDTPIAVFLRSYASPVMLQDFTADRRLLEIAIGKAIPHLQKFGSALSQPEANDYIGPQRVADYLSQVPGRKNLLWFIGGTNVAGTIPLANSSLSLNPGTLNEDTRRTYDLLQTARISIYPIDVRGLQPQGDITLPDQHLRETAFAEETGGKAFYNFNDVAIAAGHALDNGDNFYTLSYSPNDLRADGTWHELHLAVDGGHYQLSYRRGYYDDAPPSGRPAAIDGEGRKAMIAVKNPGTAEPDARSQPVVFRAKAVVDTHGSTQPKRGARGWKVHYDVPALELQHGFTNGVGTAEIGAAIVAFNQDGWVVGQVSQKVTLNFEEAAYKASPHSSLSFDQLIDLPAKGQIFLYIVLWDATTGRMGTIDLQLDGRKRAAD